MLYPSPIHCASKAQNILWQSDAIAQERANKNPPDAQDCQKCLTHQDFLGQTGESNCC